MDEEGRVVLLESVWDGLYRAYCILIRSQRTKPDAVVIRSILRDSETVALVIPFMMSFSIN